MHCLWCGQDMVITMNWRQLLFLSEPTKLCETCAKNLQIIHGQRCQICSRPSDLNVCSDCNNWKKSNHPLTFNHSVFEYNDMMQAMIARWKYRGDYILGQAFAAVFQQTFKKVFLKLNHEVIIVPVPLSDERLMERGFNQAQILADFLPMPKFNILERIHGEKQSKKTRRERLTTENPFKLHQPMSNKIILIDDIYTTGTTLRHAATSLKKGGASEVFAYTLIRG